ncbi:hypothetical protein BC830DRAFT_3309 [Chytriomyces sp. MP71]|nr:hypothetical protein BC830DRAFT_3309 [Chytriomyces sp. MP71]
MFGVIHGPLSPRQMDVELLFVFASQMFALTRRVRSTLATQQKRWLRIDPAELRTLNIPSFQEYRGRLKAGKKAAVFKDASGDLRASGRHARHAVEGEGAALLEQKAGSDGSASGLSAPELSAIYALLADTSPTPSASASASLAFFGTGASDTDLSLLLKIDAGYIAQFPPVQNHTSRVSRAVALAQRSAQALTNGKITVAKVTRVIQLNAALGRTGEAREAFDLIKEEGLRPDTQAVNALMDAHATGGDYKEAARMFAEHFGAGEGALEPDFVSYSILIKACVYAGKLRSAFEVYEGMKQKNFNPDIQVYTTLIKGCLAAKDLDRAWKTFKHMRGEICPPDTTCYTLMIHACALNGEAERALDLFREMHETGHVATEVTYTSLLQALGSRKDYYHEVWSTVGQMINAGWKVDAAACKVLMRVAGAQGDVEKLRAIWNWMVFKAANGDESMKPDQALQRHMLHALGQCLRVHRRISRKSVPAVSSSSSESGMSEVDLNVDESTISQDASSTSIVPRAAFTFVEPVSSAHALSHLHLSGTNTSPVALLADADTVWGEVVRGLDHSDGKLNSALVDTYLGVFCAGRGNIIAASKALKVYDGMYVSTDRTTSVEEREPAGLQISHMEIGNEALTLARPVEKTGWTYQMILGLITTDKKFMMERGDQIWRDFLAWDEDRERAMVSANCGARLTAAEKELVRVSEGRGKEVFKNAFVSMVKAYARTNQLPQALDTLETSTVFRDDPMYLPPIGFSDIPILVDKVRDLAEEGDLVPAKRLKELCPPPPPKNPMEEVKSMLQNKWSGGSNWWGWESLGVDENVRRKVIRQQKKKSERVKAYWANKRGKPTMQSRSETLTVTKR